MKGPGNQYPPSRSTSLKNPYRVHSIWWSGLIDIIWWSNHLEIYEEGADVISSLNKYLPARHWCTKNLRMPYLALGKHVLWNPLSTVPVECGREDIPTHSRIKEDEE